MTSRARFHASPVAWGLVLGALLGAVLAACASRSPNMPPAEVELRRKEIQDYWMQIREWRVELKLSPDPSHRPGPEEMAVQEAAQRCEMPRRQPATETCQDICTLTDAICDNRDSICRIAGQLVDDTWAQRKCDSAKQSCNEARQRCCQCTVKEQASAAPPALPRK
jgi:hypothetical protein